MYFYKKLHFSPFSRRTTGTQCLPRLRLTSGRDAPTADAQRLSRLRRAHSAFRAYGVPYESKRRGVCFPLHRGSSTEASQSLYKSEKGRNPPFPHDIRKTAAKNTEGPSPRKSPGAGSLQFIGKKSSLLFSISQWLQHNAS